MKKSCTSLVITGGIVAFSLLSTKLSLARTPENPSKQNAGANALCIGHNAVVRKNLARESETEVKPETRANPDRALEGRMLFFDRGCIVCHTVRNMGGHVGPSLDGFSKRHDRQYVVNRLADAEFVTKLRKREDDRAAYAMPPSGLNRKQVESLADYILTLP